MSDNNFQRPARKKTVLDDVKLRLTAKNQEGKNASLSWGLYQNNPRLTVYTNVEGDKDNGRISGNFNTIGFYMFLELLKQAANFVPSADKPDWRDKVVLMRPNFRPGGGRPDGVVPAGEVWVGQDKDGLVWICVSAYQRPQIKFIVTHDEYHKFEHSTGETYSPSDASKLAAKGYYNFLSKVYATLKVDEYVEPPPREPRQGGQGGGGGNYQNRQGGGGGNTYDRRGGGNTQGAGDIGGAEDDLPF